MVPSCCSPAVTSEAVISSEVVSNHHSVLSPGVVDSLAMGIQAVNSCSFDGSPSDELPVLNTLLLQVMISYVPMVQHIPRSVRPLLAQVLTSELHAACSSTWGLVRLLLFAKAVLRLPSNGRQNHRSAVHTVLSARLRTWQEPDGFLHLWEDWQQDAGARRTSPCSSSESLNIRRSLHWEREGHYGNAIQALGSQGVAETNDTRAFGPLRNCSLVILFTLHLLFL